VGVKRIKIQRIFAVLPTLLPVNTHEPSQCYRRGVFDRTAKSFLICSKPDLRQNRVNLVVRMIFNVLISKMFGLSGFHNPNLSQYRI